MNRDTELRKLPVGCLSSVEDILEINEDWKRFMFLIPSNLEDLDKEHYVKKYNMEDIRLIENYANEVKVTGAKVLFVEWGTSGRIRPTLNTLRKLLEKALIYRAADEIADMLNEPRSKRPSKGPAAHIDTSITNILNDESIEQKLNSMASISSKNFENSTHGDICNNNTVRMQSLDINFVPKFDQFLPSLSHISDFMKFTKNIDVTDFEKKDLIEFSKNISSDLNIPDFNVLNPATLRDTDTISVDSTGISNATSHTHHASQSTQSQSNFQTQNSNFNDQIDNDILSDANLFQFEYKELEAVTNNFSHCIGSGGFGDVFVGGHRSYGWLAVKKAHNQQLHVKPSLDMVKIFNNEVKALSILRHDNIVPILGFSLDGPALCIVCTYIECGSLLQIIEQHHLNESQRMNVMMGTAEGLKYIHSTVKPSPNPLPNRKAYFIHGDVKSANILLTKECVPKLCDFGLSKNFDTTFITTSVMGTSAYMAPEGLSGTITQKIDTYSYGIVLLELLTGLGPIVVLDSSTQMNIKAYVEEYMETNNVDDITPILDRYVGKWSKAQNIYEIAKNCLNMNKTHRPTMADVCKTLHSICD